MGAVVRATEEHTEKSAPNSATRVPRMQRADAQGAPHARPGRTARQGTLHASQGATRTLCVSCTPLHLWSLL